MTNKNLQLQTTADGSHTLYVEDLDEHYHSWHGAIRESQHVFVDKGLKEISAKEIQLLEIGFGTGLNAYLTCLEASKNQRMVQYDALEKHPLPREIFSKLNYPGKVGGDEGSCFETMFLSPWEEQTQVSSFFSIRKMQGDFLTYQPRRQWYHVIYFDAFAPEKQPEIWEEQHMRKLYEALVPGGILVTYSAKGAVKRMLRSIGYRVESLPGPPGKREMIRAIRPE